MTAAVADTSSGFFASRHGLVPESGNCEAVELTADMCGFRGRAGECNGLSEGLSCLPGTPELGQEAAAGAMEIEVARELLLQGLDHLECGFRSADLRDGHRAIE